MLLQRASAGSGKTYKLAKTYIRLFIAERDEQSGHYILRHPSALREVHSHILAVTFTNMATNEMKGRIVEKLAALAQTHPEPGFEPEGYKAPDFLHDFTGENPLATPVDDIIYTPEGIPATRAQIARVCRAALNVLLNDYGRFNISTIDTFFQGILRTLAYELRLNDNYHVELNDDYLAQVGVDETLMSMHSTAHSHVFDWAKQLIEERLSRGEAWNIFAKSSSPNASKSLYGELLGLAKKMRSETFKIALQQTDHYFEDMSHFRTFLREVKQGAQEPASLRRQTLQAIEHFTTRLQQKYGAQGLEMLNAGVWSSLITLRRSGVHLDLTAAKVSKKVYGQGSIYSGTVTKRDSPFKAKTPPAADEEMLSLIGAIGDAALCWEESSRYWRAVSRHLHNMAIMHDIHRHIADFREENNIIPLSETNEILSTMIADGEHPFIYERIGTHLHHYLLDEFQDTSIMQWDNLRPLLADSEAYGYDNLIIGDAKQSIYRFRNAEPELINTRVAADLPDTRILPDSLPQGSPQYRNVNTNWRSSRHVVAFNNALFSTLARHLSPQDPTLLTLYGNVEQHIHHSRNEGYIRIDFKEPVNPDTDKADPYWNLGERIDELRSRGYRLKDIAILVDRNKEGQKSIAAIMEHNREKASDPDYQPIEVISEESLKVGESIAVKVIIAVLGMISGSYADVDNSEQPGDASAPQHKPAMRAHEYDKIVANYHFYKASHPRATLPEALHTAGDDLLPREKLEEMLSRMQAVTLPALVEEIAARFISEEMSRAQSAYICALQDAVLEYCDNYPTDINSFLLWWSENGEKRSISAPDGVDAVRVMTIHKSKGLEFGVVIMPYAKWNLAPEKEETEMIWVSHTPRGVSFSSPDVVPPALPITPDYAYMSDPTCPFHADYMAFFRRCLTDQLNKAYVAFTRAVKELYICAPIPKTVKPEHRYIGVYLNACASDLQSILGTEADYEEGLFFSYGVPQHYAPSRSEREKEETARACPPLVIDRYVPAGRRGGAPAVFATPSEHASE